MFESPPFWMYIAGILLLLGPLITVHELGHYLVGRWFGVKADIFSVGFGKELFGWSDKRGTRWRVAAIPLGGYVQFKGDMNPASIPDADAVEAVSAEERAGSFHHATLWRRALIVFAGPATNIIVAIAIFAAFFMTIGQPVAVDPDASATVGEFAEDSVAKAAGMEVGDRILAIDDVAVEDFEDIRRNLAPFPNKQVTVRVDRGGEVLDFNMVAKGVVTEDGFGNKGTVGLIGIAPAALEYRYETLGPIQSVSVAAARSWDMTQLMITGVKQIVFGERSIREMGGPLRIAKFSGERLSLGVLAFVEFAALISLNLAFINLLPIPALDGGHLAFYAAEAVRRKPVSPRGMELAYRTGVLFLLALMVVVTVNDFISLPIFGS